MYLCICVLVYLYAVLPHITSSRSTRGRMMATKLRAELIPGFLPKYIGLTREKPCVSVGPFLLKVHVYHIIHNEIMLDFVFRKLFDFMHCLIPAVVAIVTNETRMN